MSSRCRSCSTPSPPLPPSSPFSITPPTANPRNQPYLKSDICKRYWEMGTMLPGSDVHLPNNRHFAGGHLCPSRRSRLAAKPVMRRSSVAVPSCPRPRRQRHVRRRLSSTPSSPSVMGCHWISGHKARPRGRVVLPLPQPLHPSSSPSFLVVLHHPSGGQPSQLALLEVQHLQALLGEGRCCRGATSGSPTTGTLSADPRAHSRVPVGGRARHEEI